MRYGRRAGAVFTMHPYAAADRKLGGGCSVLQPVLRPGTTPGRKTG